MNTIRYLIDNNALGALRPHHRVSDFFSEHCRVTEDVLYEARDSRRVTGLAGLEVAVTPAILQQLIRVMESVGPGDKTLVDLYANKGAADPGIIATALALDEQDVESLFPDTWVIVTLDKAVRAKAAEFSIATIAPHDLAATIDAANPPADG